MNQPATARVGVRGAPLRLCTDHGCAPAHYENCPTCFGWGLEKEPSAYIWRSIHRPITARQLGNPPEWMACPNCGGSPLGLGQ